MKNSAKNANNGDFSQKDCFFLGGLIGAVAGISTTCFLAKVFGQSISPKEIFTTAKDGFRWGIGKGDMPKVLPQNTVPAQYFTPYKVQRLVSGFNAPNQPSQKLAPQPVAIMEKPYLCLGKFIRQGEVSALVSKAGVGKTFLAIDIAKNPSLKKVVFFELDDFSLYQRARFEGIPSIKLVSRQEWDQYLNAIRADVSGHVTIEAVLASLIKPIAKIEQIIEKRKNLLHSLGINDTKKVDNLLLWEMFMESELCSDADTIILDCLNSLLDNSGQIIRSYLERITMHCRKTGKTLIILHHINKKGEITGSSSFSEVIDTVLLLEKENNILRINVEKARYPQGSTGCSVEMIQEGTQSVRFEVCEEEFHISHSESPFEKEILRTIKDREVIELDELSLALEASGFHNQTSIKNTLKRLEDKGYVCKADGTSWDIIKNCGIETLEVSPKIDGSIPAEVSALAENTSLSVSRSDNDSSIASSYFTLMN